MSFRVRYFAAGVANLLGVARRLGAGWAQQTPRWERLWLTCLTYLTKGEEEGGMCTTTCIVLGPQQIRRQKVGQVSQVRQSRKRHRESGCTWLGNRDRQVGPVGLLALPFDAPTPTRSLGQMKATPPLLNPKMTPKRALSEFTGQSLTLRAPDFTNVKEVPCGG